MRIALALFALCAVGIAGASAQELLSGQYQCTQNCTGQQLVFITQNGWDMNLVNEAGQPSRAWIDHPGHIWAERWNEGAVISPDGFAIQFDDGTVWQRFFPALLPPQLAPHKRHG